MLDFHHLINCFLTVHTAERNASRMYVLCTKITSSARMPLKNTGGCDLFSCEDIVLDPGARRLINTGISFKFPDGYYGVILASSFLSLMKRIDVAPDVLNFDLRFEVSVLAANNTDERVIIKTGDKIARMLVCKDVPFSLLNIDQTEQ